MTVGECIAYTDAIKQNSFPRLAKIVWLNEIEGKVQTEIMLVGRDFRKYIDEDTVQCQATFANDRVTLVRPIRAQIGGELTVCGTTLNDRKVLNVLDISEDGKTVYVESGSFEEETSTAVFRYSDCTRELLIPDPFSEVYYDYLLMKISEHTEESEEQNNRAVTFNERYAELMRWWADTYAPGGGRAKQRYSLHDPDDLLRIKSLEKRAGEDV